MNLIPICGTYDDDDARLSTPITQRICKYSKIARIAFLYASEKKNLSTVSDANQRLEPFFKTFFNFIWIINSKITDEAYKLVSIHFIRFFVRLDHRIQIETMKRTDERINSLLFNEKDVLCSFLCIEMNLNIEYKQ